MLENGMVLYTEPEEMPEPVCPECGRVCEYLYKRDYEILGCEHCIKEVDAFEELYYD